MAESCQMFELPRNIMSAEEHRAHLARLYPKCSHPVVNNIQPPADVILPPVEPFMKEEFLMKELAAMERKYNDLFAEKSIKINLPEEPMNELTSKILRHDPETIIKYGNIIYFSYLNKQVALYRDFTE